MNRKRNLSVSLLYLKYGHHKTAYYKTSYLDGVEWNDDIHEIYLNAEVKDDSALSEMLQYFKTADPDDSRFGPLSKSVRKYKYVDKEVNTMCRAVEEYAEEIAKEREKIAADKANKEAADKAAREMANTKAEIVSSLLKKGFSLSEALEIAKIDEDTYNRYKTA